MQYQGNTYPIITATCIATSYARLAFIKETENKSKIHWTGWSHIFGAPCLAFQFKLVVVSKVKVRADCILHSTRHRMVKVYINYPESSKPDHGLVAKFVRAHEHCSRYSTRFFIIWGINRVKGSRKLVETLAIACRSFEYSCTIGMKLNSLFIAKFADGQYIIPRSRFSSEFLVRQFQEKRYKSWFRQAIA